MTPATFVPLAVAALLALSGCASNPNPESLPARSEPARRTRTAEKFCRFEGTLSITVDPEFGYGNLAIPRPKEKSFSLVISSEDLPKLQKLDKTRSYEVRYWYYEESLLADVMIGRGELISIRSASSVILDLSRCALHNVDMVRRPVPIVYGLPMKEYLDAMKRDFPHSAAILGGCVVDDSSPKEVPHYVCPKCEAAAKVWSDSFLANQK